jgi:CRP-like cAMP-binding protein
MACAAKYRNKILCGLDAADLAAIEPHLVPTELKFRQRLEQASRPIKQVYFLESGLGSVVAMSYRLRRQAEVAVIGAEGMTGQAVVLGAIQSPYETFMQIAGDGYAIETELMLAVMDQRPVLAECFLRFAHVVAIQTGLTALANAEGSVEERLCRWLLMSLDRTGGGEMKLTHEFLAVMLGVRRPGVTIALQRLEQKALIATKRGSILILDRGGLEELANGLYGVPEGEYTRLFP